MINSAGAELLTKSERIVLKAYFCPAGVPTIGRGHTEGITAQMVKDGYTITVDQEAQLFTDDMIEWETNVRACLTRKPNENQLAAMICFAYNIGMGAFKKSTVCKQFNAGNDAAAGRAFGLWNKARVNGELKVLNGLVTRRAAEAALYSTPVPGDHTFMVQKVEPPKPMAASKINQGAAVAGGTATIAVVSETVKQVESIKTSVDGMALGSWLMPVLLVVIVVAAAYIGWQRWGQRKEGAA